MPGTIKTLTIANTASLSGEIDLEGYNLFAIEMPSSWTAANLTLQAASSSGGTFKDVYDDGGQEVVVTAAANRIIAVDISSLKLASLRFIKIRSGTTGTPVAQGADRTLTIILKK